MGKAAMCNVAFSLFLRLREIGKFVYILKSLDQTLRESRMIYPWKSNFYNQ